MKDFRENCNDDSLRVEPVKSYTQPNLPTQEEANPAQLTKLPSRWQKNAAVIACMGFVGAVTLSGCAYMFDSVFASRNSMHGGGAPVIPRYTPSITEHDVATYTQTQLEAALAAAELELRVHSGGGGAGPFYVVHITEQEALNIIRAKLEAAGLSFGDTPPENVFEFGWTEVDDIRLDLFDAEKGVAISHLSWETNNTPFMSHGGSHLAEEVARDFNEQLDDVAVGVFFNPGEYLGMSSRLLDWWLPEDVQERIESLTEHLERLHSETFNPDAWVGDITEEQWQEMNADSIAWVERDIADYKRILSGEEFPTPEIEAEAKAVLIDQLTVQVQDFIDFLHAEGILEKQGDAQL